MSGARPVDAWRDFFAVYGQIDNVEKALAFVDPELVWETGWPGLDSVYHGHDGLRRWAAGVLEPMEWAKVELLEAKELDDRRVFLVTRLHGRGRGSGVDTEMTVYDLWTFGPAGMRERRVFFDRAAAEEAAGIS